MLVSVIERSRSPFTLVLLDQEEEVEEEEEMDEEMDEEMEEQMEENDGACDLSVFGSRFSNSLF